MIDYRWVSLLMGLMVSGVIVFLVRRDRLHTRFAGWWVMIALVVAATGAFPGIVDWIASRLGIHYPPVLALVTGMGLLLIKLLLMDIEHSRTELRLLRLTQRLALLEESCRRGKGGDE
ncbi:DUF2304 family protein [Endothiovibrio diazotrophicus]